MVPEARHDRLIVREVGDETLVYDLRSHKAHCLNSTAVEVWRRCDGRSEVAEIASQVSQKLGSNVSEEVVVLALQRLAKARLLEGPAPESLPATRRAALESLAKASGLAVALPAVWSIVAPTAAYAASACIPAAACVAADGKCCTNGPGNSNTCNGVAMCMGADMGCNCP